MKIVISTLFVFLTSISYAQNEKLFMAFDIASMSENGIKRLKHELFEYTADPYVDYVTNNGSPEGALTICIKFNDSTQAKYWYEISVGIHEKSPNAYKGDTKKISLLSHCPKG